MNVLLLVIVIVIVIVNVLYMRIFKVIDLGYS